MKNFKSLAYTKLENTSALCLSHLIGNCILLTSKLPTYDLAHVLSIFKNKRKSFLGSLVCDQRIRLHFKDMITSIAESKSKSFKGRKSEDKTINRTTCNKRNTLIGKHWAELLTKTMSEMVSLPDSNHFDPFIRATSASPQTSNLKTNRGCLESLKFCVGFITENFYKMKDFLKSERPKAYLEQAFPELKALHPIFLIARKKLLSIKPQGRPKLIRKKSDITDHQVEKNICKVAEDLMAKTFDGNVRVWIANEKGWQEHTKLSYEWDLADYIRKFKPLKETKSELFALGKGKKLKNLGIIVYNYYMDMLKKELGLAWKTHKGQKYLCQNIPAPRSPEQKATDGSKSHLQPTNRYHVAKDADVESYDLAAAFKSLEVVMAKQELEESKRKFKERQEQLEKEFPERLKKKKEERKKGNSNEKSLEKLMEKSRKTVLTPKVIPPAPISKPPIPENSLQEMLAIEQLMREVGRSEQEIEAMKREYRFK